MLSQQIIKKENNNLSETLPNDIFMHVIFSFFSGKELLIQKRVSKQYKFFSEKILKKTENNIFYAFNSLSVVEIGKEIQKGSSVKYEINKTVSANQLLEAFQYEFDTDSAKNIKKLNFGMKLFASEEKALTYMMEFENRFQTGGLYNSIGIQGPFDDTRRIFVKPIYKVQVTQEKVHNEGYAIYGYCGHTEMTIPELKNYLTSYQGYYGKHVKLPYLIPLTASVKYKLHYADQTITTFVENVNLKNVEKNDLIAPAKNHTCKIL